MRIAQPLVTTWLSIMLLGAVAQSAPGDSARGRDIHFRGPLFVLSRDTSGHTVQLTIGVNNGQVDVQVNSWTEVIIGRGFTADRSRLRLGDFVEVSGFFTASGAIVAQRIHVENRDVMELQGQIEAVNGNLIQIDGLDFLVYEDSVIRSSNGPVAAGAALSVGEQVRVRAGEDGGAWRLYELEVGPRTVDSEPLRLEGIFMGFYDYGNGVTNKNLLMVDVGIRSGGQPVNTPVACNQDTVVEGELRPGRLVQIEWMFSRSPGNQLLPVASHIVVDSNDNNNVFDDSAGDGSPVECELKGTVQGLGPGQGGHLQFYIQETLVRLNAQTQLRFQNGNPADVSLLADGLEVEVTGTRLQDRTIQANQIEIRQRDSESDGVSGDSNDTPGSDSGGDTGSDTGTPGEQEPDPGSGSGDVGTTPPEGSGGDGGSVDNGGGPNPGDNTGETEPATREISGAITELHQREDETVDRITVNSVIIEVTAQTVIEDEKSNEMSSSALRVGQTVEVEAVERTDGTVFARRIVIEE
ncbi:MAG: DUF5666 domain-containing protein [Acidobacteriota bacterium]